MSINGRAIKIKTVRADATKCEGIVKQLGVTFQAVSKWENDTGMPDISQVVSLANVFGVTTDALFGMNSTDADADAEALERGE